MSLKLTDKNRVCGVMLSAADWARHAIGSDKVSGPEGFENYESEGWYYWWHYKKISKTNPDLSPPEALEEMASYRESLVEDIIRTAKALDEKIKRLQRMEEQMRAVAEESES